MRKLRIRIHLRLDSSRRERILRELETGTGGRGGEMNLRQKAKKLKKENEKLNKLLEQHKPTMYRKFITEDYDIEALKVSLLCDTESEKVREWAEESIAREIGAYMRKNGFIEYHYHQLGNQELTGIAKVLRRKRNGSRILP